MAYEVPMIRINPVALSQSTFTPMEYQGFGKDPNGYDELDAVFAAQSDMRHKAYEQQDAVDTALVGIQNSLHNDPKTMAWFNKYKAGIKEQINDEIEGGSYDDAIRLAKRLAIGVLEDPNVQGRIEQNKIYQQNLSVVQDLYKNKKISPTTYDRWMAQNQYYYDDKQRDAAGNGRPGEQWRPNWMPHEALDMNDVVKNIFNNISPQYDVARTYDVIKDIQNGNVIEHQKETRHNSRQYITPDMIADNIEVYFNTPLKREQLQQEFEDAIWEYKKLKDEIDYYENSADTTDPEIAAKYSKAQYDIAQYEKLLNKNGNVDFIDYNNFLFNLIRNNPIVKNRGYEMIIDTSSLSVPSVGGSGGGKEDEDDPKQDNPTDTPTASGKPTESQESQSDEKRRTDDAAKGIGNMHKQKQGNNAPGSNNAKNRK